MSKYRIFTESKEFVFTNNVVLCGVFGVIVFLYLLQEYIFSWFLISERNYQFLMLLPVCLALYYKLFLSWQKYEPLEGTLNTYLELNENVIIIENAKYSLTEIKSIEILNFDFKGDRNYSGGGNYNGILSNGIGNLFKINLVEGKSIEVNFQQDNQNEIASAKKELVSYYTNGKISRENFLKIFGYNESDKDIVEAIVKYHS